MLRRLSRTLATGTPPPAALTRIITRAPSASELLLIHDRHHAAFNAIHCSALWVSLGRLARRADGMERTWLRSNPRAVEHSRERTVAMLPTLQPRELANTAHGVASVGVGSAAPWADFWTRAAAAALPQLDRFNAAELTSTAWSFATARARAPELFDAIAGEALVRLEGLRAEEASMIAWSFPAAHTQCS